jgi:catechol 2,3-dioxygenase-like lactoylglutathione lyase family enzyme
VDKVKKALLIAVVGLVFMTATAQVPDADGEAKTIHKDSGTFYHVGFWVADLDETTEFLSLVMDLTTVTRMDRATGGERLILQDVRGQKIELLSDPAAVVPHPDFPLHPTGRVAGVAHISIQVDDVIRLRDVLTNQGYKVLAQVPVDYSDGYEVSGTSEHRILFIAGPDDMTFELFEIRP